MEITEAILVNSNKRTHGNLSKVIETHINSKPITTINDSILVIDKKFIKIRDIIYIDNKDSEDKQDYFTIILKNQSEVKIDKVYLKSTLLTWINTLNKKANKIL